MASGFAATTKRRYNNVGELFEYVSPNSDVTSHVYDDFGRLKEDKGR